MIDFHRFLGFWVTQIRNILAHSVSYGIFGQYYPGNSLKPKKPRNINFKAKFLTKFDPFGSALIGALVMSISDSFYACYLTISSV